MTSPVPDEAVEAAATATQEVCETYDPGGWTEDENWKIWAKQILEAAAPFIAAHAWDEGARAMFVDDPFKPTPTNPYRSGTHEG